MTFTDWRVNAILEAEKNGASCRTDRLDAAVTILADKCAKMEDMLQIIMRQAYKGKIWNKTELAKEIEEFLTETIGVKVKL